MEEMLKDDNDIIPKELLVGLSPNRGIAHQIDLIQGLILPNEVSYRLSPRENEEMN